MAKIVITANTSWYLYNFRKNTILSLIHAGHDVIAVAPQDEYSCNIKKMGADFVHISIDKGGTNPFRDIFTLFSFYRIYKGLRCDVVLNFTPKNNIYSTLASHVCGAKAINNIAGLGVLFIDETYSSKIARQLYKLSQKFAKKVFFQNEDDRALFIENKITPVEITERLPGSGADLSRFKLSISKDDGVVSFLLIARMLYDKGIMHYIEAARELKFKYQGQIDFRLLGFLDVDNPSAVSRKEMQAWVDEGIVDYLGTSDSVETEISKVDCVVLPSFYREGVPKSLLEAGAMGKPIITTDNVGCRETVDDSVNGFICQPRSTKSLVSSLDKMFKLTHDERLAMGRASRLKMETEFDEK
ncbi:glycosyltransferase family 4 protein, partial [Shewanella schlegeliana]